MDVIPAISALAEQENRAEGDYINEADGLLYCGKCHTPKQARVSFHIDGNQKRAVPIACQCENQAAEVAQEIARKMEFRRRMAELRKGGITDPAYLRYTFAADDRQDPALSDVCRRYVERWAEMEAQNIGILFHGTVGTGKSFYACAIANALVDQCIPAMVTSFPRLLNLLQSAQNRQEIIDGLDRYRLLVIDDLGVERDSSYAAEQIYGVIDARARSGKPLIITTNLPYSELETPVSMQYKRIYDRILELCPVALKMTGDSRRVKNAAAKKAAAKALLQG